MSFFFFFQAEDGIRDLTVTGVQTCALPIYPAALRTSHAFFPLVIGPAGADGTTVPRSARVATLHASTEGLQDTAHRERSEERRVGKECRCRWGVHHRKAKKEKTGGREDREE